MAPHRISSHLVTRQRRRERGRGRRDGGERLDHQLPGGHPGRGGHRGGHLGRLRLLLRGARGRRLWGGEEAGQVVAHAAGARPLQPGVLLHGGGHLRLRRDRPLQDLGPHVGDEEPAGAEHAAGEHALADLEPRQEEEADKCINLLNCV
uniref:Uncharacterized protein n=1 Tax=Triticum urartu TaxID=4572 RepID=A0A8R7R6Y7_TRIUA